MSHSPTPQLNEHNVHPVYRPDIDGLRAVAILSVVIFHAFPFRLPGGFVGVDVFFVISGFLISTIIFRSLQRGDFSFSEFYAHRIKRIFPALIVVLTACYAFGWFALLPDEFKQLGKHMASGAGFIQNFILWQEVGYFDTAAELKPLLHLWSLAIEEQFYLIFPVLIFAVWRIGLNVLTVILLLGLISFGLNITGVTANPTETFFMPQTRFWELLAGSILAYLQFFKRAKFSALMQHWVFHPVVFRHPPDSRRRGDVLNNILSVVGLLLIVVAVFLVNKSKPFPGWWALLPVSGAFFMILAGPEAWGNRVILANKLMVFVGLISYPLYLWHWPILSFARIIEGEVPSREIRMGAVVLSLVLAWLTYRLIERPIRFGKKTWIKTAALTVALVVVGYVGYNTFIRDGLSFRRNIAHMKKVNAEYVGALWSYTKNERCLSKYPLEGVEKYGWWFCMSSKDSPPSLLLLGNSYANHLYPGIVHNKGLEHHSVLSIGTCGPEWLEGNGPQTMKDNEFSPCAGYRPWRQHELINKIIAQGSIRFVIISGLPTEIDQEGILRLKKRIDFIEDNGSKVIVLYPHLIKLDYDTKACFGRPFKRTEKNCEVSRANYDFEIAKFKPVLESISKTNSAVKFFNQNELFCDENKCSAIINGMPIYRDIYNHYSEYASEVVARGLEAWAKENQPTLLH